jgi:acyl-coenzyme A thioesterase PaaI-like protein
MLSPLELRKSIRYSLRLPVVVKLGNAQMSARSENISENGILLSSDFLILQGSSVELTVDLTRSPEKGVSLTAHGKVLRVHPKASGGFAMAIGCDVPFRITHH